MDTANQQKQKNTVHTEAEKTLPVNSRSFTTTNAIQTSEGNKLTYKLNNFNIMHIIASKIGNIN